MNDDLWTKQMIADAAAWEGGIEEYIRGGWLREDFVVPEIRNDVVRVLEAYEAFEEAVEALNLSEPGVEEW